MKIPQWTDFRTMPVPEGMSDAPMAYRVNLHKAAMKEYYRLAYPKRDETQKGRNVTGIPMPFNRSFVD